MLKSRAKSIIAMCDRGLSCYYSLNNPVTDARYSGQLSESCSLVA